MNPSIQIARIIPGAAGWILRSGDGPEQSAPTLAEAAAALPAGQRVHLALPCPTLIFERLTLPATGRDELAGMVRLQSEKTLPFPIEEAAVDFAILAAGEHESTVVSVCAPHAALELLCASLRARLIVPEIVTPFVLHVAAACPANETVLAVYVELGQMVVAIAEGGRLSWTHVLASTDPERVAAELPQLLLPAIMEGVATTFSCVLLARECAALEGTLREFFEVPVDPLPLAVSELASPINLLPVSWQAEQRRQRRGKELRQRLLIGAAVYTLVAASVIAYLATLRWQARKLEAQLTAARPQLEWIQARQARFHALAGAIDPNHYAIELLYLLQRSIPSDGLTITEFDQVLNQWRVTGEAPSASLAIDYVTRLKDDKELALYQINAGPPQLLPNEHAQFSILGKR